MQMDQSFRDKVHQLLALRPARERKNEALFLIKLTGFPSLLTTGKHDKSMQNRASDYASHLNFALAAKVMPGEFVAFTSEGGLPRSETLERGRARGPQSRPDSLRAKAGPTASPLQGKPLFPSGIWLNSSEVGQKLMEAFAAAKSEAQQIDARLYICADYTVVVGAKTLPWRAPSPIPMLQIIDSSATERRRRPKQGRK